MSEHVKQRLRHQKFIASVLLGGCVLMASSVVLADPPPWAGNPHDASPRDRAQGQPGSEHRSVHKLRHGHFQVSTRERIYIQDWYRRHRPHGLVRKEQLPPGIAKKIYPGSSWPPPYAYRRLPSNLVRDLQPLPSGYHYFEVNGAVVIADVAGHVVSDVVYDLLTR